MERTTALPRPGVPLDFRAGLRAETVPGEAVYVFSEHGVTALRGRHVEAVAPLLDGTRDLADLQRAAPAGLPPDAVTELVARLFDAGLVGPYGRPSGPDDAYWEAAGVAPGAAEAAIAGTRVRPVVVGEVDADTVVDALTAAGLRTREPLRLAAGESLPRSSEPGVSVVLCPDYLTPDLAEVDAVHRAEGRPWLLARPTGTRVWVGPVFDPATGGPCWHCLAHRLRQHRQAELRARSALGHSDPGGGPSVTIPALTRAATDVVALEAAKWVAGYLPQRQPAVWTLDSLTLESRRHELRARPQCPSCGDPSHMRAQARRPVTLRSRAKAPDGGAGHRSRPPQEVLDDFGHLVSPVTGVVKELRRVAGPAEFDAYRSGPNLAAVGTGLAGVRAAHRAENGGKGVTDLHAKVSALCEALERRSGTFHGDEERVRASYAALPERAVHPDSCMLFDPRQYADREAWNAEHGAFQHVCDPFDEEAELDWSPVWSLTEERHRLLPTGMLYFGAPREPGWSPVRADSNGNAAGTCLEDAILQGTLELIERDAVALWWYNRTRQPAVDLPAFGDPWVERMRGAYAGIGREFWVLDVTSDLGVPAMAAVTRRTGGEREEVMLGFGAHTDPRVALRRAVAEMNQLVLNVIDGTSGWRDPDAARWLSGPGTAGERYLLPDPGQRARGPADYAHTPSHDLRADVLALRDLFARRGLEMLVLDQTRPDIGLPVVKVVVPGLRGFWARFAPGRLFDVPVALGRRSTPVDYADLNPFPLFL